jgi:predicted DNA-binding WGR domain protein
MDAETFTWRWQSPAKRRYYAARVQRDLLGDLILMCAWGGIGNRLGGTSTRPLASMEEARAALAALAEQRRRHRYVRV